MICLRHTLVLLLHVLPFTSGNIQCKEPNQLPVLRASFLEESSLILPGYVRNIQNGDLGSIPEMYKNITRTMTERNPSYSPPPSPRSHCSVRSTCPWHFVLNKDNNRIPSELVEAQCKTRMCKRQRRSVFSDSMCREIFYYVKVHRRVSCVNNIYQYKEVNEPVAAGCSCVGSAINVMPI